MVYPMPSFIESSMKTQNIIMILMEICLILELILLFSRMIRSVGKRKIMITAVEFFLSFLFMSVLLNEHIPHVDHGHYKPLFHSFPAYLMLLLVILLFILPSFAMLFETLGITLPLAAQAGLALGLFLRHWGLLLGLGLSAVLIAGALHFQTRAGRRRKEAWLYHSAFYRRLLLIRFTLSLASFLESGKPLSEALAASTKVLGNHIAEEKVHGMERKLRQGENFASVWEASGFCFPLLFELCQVGLSSGELPRFLNQAARLMTAETEEKLRRFRHIAAPVMLLFVGGLTALVLFSVMLPVFQMAGSHLAK